MLLTYWLFVAGVLLFTAFISYGTYRTAQLLKHWRPPQNILLHPLENLARLGMIALCLGLGWLSGLSRQTLGWQVHSWGNQVLLGGAIGLGAGIFFFLSTRWIMARTGRRVYSTVVIEQIAPTSNRELVLVLLAMLPVVLLEELLFRSLLLGGFSPILPVPVLLLGLTLLFGLLHGPQGIWGMIGAGLAGLLFGLIFLGQASLLTPVAAHYVTNAFQIVQARRYYGDQAAAG
jgi:membrane protease YdiL (CAAX protease family)